MRLGPFQRCATVSSALNSAALLGLAAVIVVACTRAPHAQPNIPLPEGRYVASPVDCALSNADLDLMRGEGVGSRVITIQGNAVDYHPGRCEILDGDVSDGTYFFAQRCSAEGEFYTNVRQWRLTSTTSFREFETEYYLCPESTAQAAPAPDRSSTQPVNNAIGPDAVYAAQVALRRLGFNPGPIDGEFGRRTRDAMNAYQRQTGLPVTRDLDVETHRRLMEADQALFEDAAMAVPDEPPSPETVEPAAGDAPPERGSYADMMAVRANLQDEPGIVIENLEGKVDDSLLLILNNDLIAISNLLDTSTVFVGCLDRSPHVFGFFNVIQNIWLFAWTDSKLGIVDVDVSKGLVPKDMPSGIAWYDFQKSGSSVPEGLDQAYQIQAASFVRIFEGAGCDDVIERGDQFFTSNAAIGALIANSETLASVPEAFSRTAHEVTVEREKIEEEHSIALSFTLPVSSTDEIDYITFHSNRPTNMLYLIQSWKWGDGGELTLAGREVVDLAARVFE